MRPVSFILHLLNLSLSGPFAVTKRSFSTFKGPITSSRRLGVKLCRNRRNFFQARILCGFTFVLTTQMWTEDSRRRCLTRNYSVSIMTPHKSLSSVTVARHEGKGEASEWNDVIYSTQCVANSSSYLAGCNTSRLRLVKDCVQPWSFATEEFIAKGCLYKRYGDLKSVSELGVDWVVLAHG